MSNVPARGWFVTVTDPDSSYTHPAAVLGSRDSVSLSPKANARPTVRIPVRKSDKWGEVLGDGSEDVDLDVWQDGERVPVDTLEDVEQEPGATVLVGSGGRELETRIEEFIEQEAVHAAAERLIDDNTAYTSNVDTPTTTTQTNETLITLTTSSDFLTRATLIDTDPVVVESGTLKLGQSGYFEEGEDFDRDNGGTLSTVGDYSDGEAWRIEGAGEWIEWDFTIEYPIPGDDVGLAVRKDNENSAASYDADFYIDGVLVDTLGFDGALTWDQVGDGAFGGDGWTGGQLDAGSHTVRIENNASSWLDIDCVFLYDKGDRFGGFTYNFDNSVDGDDHLAGPELYPDDYVVRFNQIAAPQAVTGIRAEATLAAGDSDYTHYVSNDQGSNFTTGTGANLETDSLGADYGPGVTYKAGLSRFGTRTTESPTSGFNGHELQELVIKADLEDMPLVVNTAFDNSLDAVLARLAGIGDQLWAYERDGDTESIEWTTPGQRTATSSPEVADYRATKTVGQVYQEAVVYGKPDVTVTGERFEADHGNASGLAHERLEPGSEVVVDPDTGERFRRNEDYTIDYQAGELTALAAGDTTDGDTYEIDYNYQPFAAYDDGTADPDTVDVDLPGLTTTYACEQAARLIVDEVSSPIQTAQVTIPSTETVFSVVESLDPDIVPTGGEALHIRETNPTPEGTVLTLGSRRGLDDVVGDLRAQTGALSRQS